MAGRPKKDDSREKQYRVRLNDEEETWLNFASSETGKKKSDIFRIALKDYYEKVRVQHFAFENEYELGLEDSSINLKRIVTCPYCAEENRIDLEDDCAVSSDDRQMGMEMLYEFNHSEFECTSCGKVFAVSGFVSEYPLGALNAEEIKVECLDNCEEEEYG